MFEVEFEEGVDSIRKNLETLLNPSLAIMAFGKSMYLALCKLLQTVVFYTNL